MGWGGMVECFLLLSEMDDWTGCPVHGVSPLEIP